MSAAILISLLTLFVWLVVCSVVLAALSIILMLASGVFKAAKNHKPTPSSGKMSGAINNVISRSPADGSWARTADWVAVAVADKKSGASND